MNEKPKKIELKPGKSEFHRFVVSRPKLEPVYLSPCICEFNVDFVPGCIANTNPYFRNAHEIISGSVLNQPREEVLMRLDETLDGVVSKLDKRLRPDIRKTSDFPETLKEKIWKILHEQVSSYQGITGKIRTEGDLSRFFESGMLADGFLNGCAYCYAGHKNNRQNLFVDDVDFSIMEKQLPEILNNPENRKRGILKKDGDGKYRMTIRIGKDTEGGAIFYLNHLLHFLDFVNTQNQKLRRENDWFSGMSIHMPTKMLPFDPEIARLLRETKSSVGYSIAYEDAEKGTILYGWDNFARMNAARDYANSGVSSGLRISHDASVSFEESNSENAERRKVSSHIYDISEFHSKNPQVWLQLIPMRIQRNRDARIITGHTRDELKHAANGEMFGHINVEGIYGKRGNNELVPASIHEDYRRLFTDSKGQFHVCADHNEGEVSFFGCDSCMISGLPGIKIDNKFNIKPDSRNYNERRKEKNKQVPGQMSLIGTQVK